MHSKRFAIENATPVYLAFVGAMLLMAIYSCVFDYVLLSVFLGAPFIVGLLIADKTRSELVVFFALAALVSGWLSSLGFFLERDKYTYSGFSAVKNFTFSVIEYIEYYLPIIACYFVILFTSILIVGNNHSLNGSRASQRSAALTSGYMPRFSFMGGLIISVLILFMSLINLWMFNNSIGITGISPPELPYRLSGILYYLSRFIFPLIITLALIRSRATALSLLLIAGYAIFAAITSVSKTTLVLLFVPLLIYCSLNKRYLLAIFFAALLGASYPLVNEARNFVFLVDSGVSIRNLEYSIHQVIFNTIDNIEVDMVLAAPLSILERIGGGQDVALAAQYDNELIGGPFVEFIRLYIFDFFNVTESAQSLMFDYSFDVAGYSPGDGGFFARMLLVAKDSRLILFLVGIYQGFILAIANSTYWRLVKLGLPRELVSLYAILFCVFYFALSIPLWLNFFIAVTFILARSSCIVSFTRSLQSPLNRPPRP